ncbi:hypothetical protein LPB248_06700 [Flavobacterium sp. LPB0248]|uniref:hypothetical protein n=1 Tax=Flavobacterium sp. LPB0248 TaxID=2614441 RepID=UPI0015A5CC5A|nr:hypothetical protein [Flavobacterium sp. LPB0248]QLC65978.1 hypothetical protein LPB248_06700 [Flavobacterium sp. LPB0248]
MEIIIRKSYLFWDGDAYKYGGFGQIIGKCFSVSEAEDLIEKLTIDFLRNDNPIIKDFVFSTNDYDKDLELIEKVSSFFEQEFELDFETDFWLPSSATDNQVLELSKLFPFPFYSLIEKENNHFYINELNDAFWTEDEITAIKISDWDFTNICPGMTGPIKQLYNDDEMAKKDGIKKMLSHLINENHGLFSKLENVKEQQFVRDWQNQISYYSEILPNNIQSKKTEEIIERVKSIVNIESVFKTKEISFEEAMSFEEIM